MPKNLIPLVRKVFIYYMDLIIKEHQNVLLWKKFLSLSMLLFSDIDGGMVGRRSSIKKRCEDALNDDWSQITVSRFQKRRVVSGVNGAFHNDNEVDVEKLTNSQSKNIEQAKRNWNKRIKDLATEGKIGHIMKMIEREGQTTSVDESTADKLRDKFPDPYQEMDEEFMNVPSCSHAAADIGVNPDSLRSIIKSKAKGIKDGHDKNRYEHQNILVGSGGVGNIDEDKYTEGLTAIVSFIINRMTSIGLF